LQRELFYLFQLAYFFWTIHQMRALNYKILLVSRHQNRLDKLLEAPGKHFNAAQDRSTGRTHSIAICLVTVNFCSSVRK